MGEGAPLRAAVIGGGHMGRIHARKLLANPEVELVAVVDPAPLDGVELPWADELPEGIDLAVVAVPTTLHLKVALPLLEAGVACLVEKPLAASVEEAVLLAPFERLMVNHIERFNPALEPLLGSSARYIKCERLAPAPKGGTLRCADVDVVHDLMVHDLDLVRHLSGGEVVEVRAVGASLITEGVDIAEVWCETDNGCVALLTASRASSTRTRTIRLVDGDSYFSVDLDRRSASRTAWSDDLSREELGGFDGDAIERAHAAFIAMARGEATSPVTGRDGLAVVELAARVSAAIEERR